MLRKLLALLLVVGFIGQASGLVWDVEKLFTGRQMVPYGGPWIADDQITYWGTGKDFAITYDETTDDRTELTATNGMYFDVGAVTFYSSDPANESLTFTGFYPKFAGGIYVLDDQKIYLGTGGDGYFEYDENGVDKVIYAGADFLIADDVDLEFGAGGDAVFEYDEDDTDTLLYDGASIRITDDTKVEFGTGGDGSIEYDEDGTDKVIISGAVNFANNVDIDGTFDVDGATTLDGVTVAEEATFAASVVTTPFVDNANSAIVVGDNDYFAFHIGDSAGTQTVTLPTAADNSGRRLLFVITEDPGENNFVIDGEGDETVGGAATKTCTDAVGSFYYIYCTGTSWITLGSGGTWS